VVDRLTLYAAKSIAKLLGDTVPGIDAAYITSSDFDYDKKPNPSNPRDTILRALPFIGVGVVSDDNVPFTVSANILYERNMVFNVEVLGTGISQLINLSGDVKQQLNRATHSVSGKVGVPLYDFGAPSGTFFDLKGAIPIFEYGATNYIGPSDELEQENRKYRSSTVIVLSAFKDKDAELIENLGNIGINE